MHRVGSLYNIIQDARSTEHKICNFMFELLFLLKLQKFILHIYILILRAICFKKFFYFKFQINM
jgi:hypothetical protein